MIRKCKGCGVEFTPRSGDQFLCEECAKKVLSDSVHRRVKCRICGRYFDGYVRSYYCPECRAEVERERNAKFKREGAKRKLGSIDYCEKCGKEYVVNSGLQRYCPDCREAAVKENISRSKTDWYFNRGGREQHIESRERLKKKANVCPICGKTYTPRKSSRNYCSEECAEIARKTGNTVKRNREPFSEKMDVRNKTGVRGVHWSEREQRYIAKITYNKKTQCLGHFRTLEEAAKARSDAEEKIKSEIK